MQLISKFNKGFYFVLWVLDILSKYARVFPLKYQRSIIVTLIAKQTKNGQIKAVNFEIDQ